jgi:hypothetical protein
MSMKNLFLLLLMFTAFGVPTALAQEFQPDVTYLVVKNDGTRFVGQIISSDAREVLIRTSDRGDVAVPKHEIRSITEYSPSDDRLKEIFATRYFLTTNGLPMDEGDSYIQWTLIGPDVHFGLKNNRSIGVMTSWVASPVIISYKYSAEISERRSYALGVLAGSTLWNFSDGVRIALPYASYTMGDKMSNISFSAGYGVAYYDGESGGQAMFSVAGMHKISRSGTFVFDSLIFVNDGDVLALLVPGVRLQTKENSAFQFGFPGVFYSGSSRPLGFPVVSWFRKL